MDDKAAAAVRSKKDSTMRVGLKLVREGQARGFVTAGNTGAAMATAKMVLGTLPGVDRPALAAILPTLHGTPCTLLDVGANVDSDPKTSSSSPSWARSTRATSSASPSRASVCSPSAKKMARATPSPAKPSPSSAPSRQTSSTIPRQRRRPRPLQRHRGRRRLRRFRRQRRLKGDRRSRPARFRQPPPHPQVHHHLPGRRPPQPQGVSKLQAPPRLHRVRRSPPARRPRRRASSATAPPTRTPSTTPSASPPNLPKPTSPATSKRPSPASPHLHRCSTQRKMPC